MPSTAEVSESVRPLLAGLHVLVVDDNEDSREVLSRVLVFMGAIVTTVAGADAALDVVRTITPNVIVSDLSMPDRDGYWLVGMLRAALPGVPAIAITAYRESQPEDRAYAAGFKVYLEKPLDFRHLVTAILRLAGRPPAV
jgi:CheY-like chemotaxis protein